MERIYTTQVGAHVGERVRLAGWLHALRRMGGINFLVLRDVRGAVQVVVDTPEALNLCIGCGSCTGTCSTGHFTEFNIRKIHTLIKRGDTEMARKQIRQCMFCGKCQLICPRGINLRNVILGINRALEKI